MGGFMAREKKDIFVSYGTKAFKQEWEEAKRELLEKKDGTKISRKKGGFSHSFIKLNGQVYILGHSEEKEVPHRIGKGSFGTVKYLMDEHDNVFAVKIEKTDGKDISSATSESIIAKALGLNIGDRQLRDDKNKYYSVMHYLGQNLKAYLVHNKTIPPTQRIDMAIQICLQVDNIHGKKIVHRDIKPDNFVIDENGKISLIDFGLANYLDDKDEFALLEGEWLDGTPAYLPITKSEHSNLNKETQYKETQSALVDRKRKMGHIGTDITAVKRVLLSDITPGEALFTQRQLQRTLLVPEAISENINKNNIYFEKPLKKVSRTELRSLAAMLIQFKNDLVEARVVDRESFKKAQVERKELYDDKKYATIIKQKNKQDELIQGYLGTAPLIDLDIEEEGGELFKVEEISGKSLAGKGVIVEQLRIYGGESSRTTLFGGKDKTSIEVPENKTGKVEIDEQNLGSVIPTKGNG